MGSWETDSEISIIIQDTLVGRVLEIHPCGEEGKSAGLGGEKGLRCTDISAYSPGNFQRAGKYPPVIVK